VKRHLAWRSDGFTDVREATALAFSPDCATLALGDQFGAISAWDVASGARRWSAAAHTGERAVQWRDGRGFGVSTVSDAAGVAALAFSPDGRTLASGGGTASGRGELRLWDAERGSPLATLPAEGGPVRQVAFSARGDRLTVLLRRDGQDDRGAATLLEVWSARGPERALLAADTAPIAHLAFSADGARLASEGATRTTTWDLARGRLERAVPTPRHEDDGGTPSALSVRAPRGDVQVFARERAIWVQRGNDVPARLDSADAAYAFHAEPIQSLHLRADGRLLSLGGYEHPRDRPAELIVWDLATRRAVAHAFEPSNVVAALALSPDERTFVTAGALGPALGHAGFVHVWDAERLTVRASLPGHRALVTAVAFSPDGRRLATGDASGFVRVWELR
jgi:WD40 repeat protein